MDIRKARDIAFHVGIGNGRMYSPDELSEAFHRLDRSQPEKRNRLIMQADRRAATRIWDYVGGKSGIRW